MSETDQEPGAEPTDTLPRCVGRYELLHEFAVGGMATVYLGRARGVAGFERLVAIKCCHPHLRHAEPFSKMFLDEARLAARIHHPNVVATLDVGEANEASLYLVMEFVDGFSLMEMRRTMTRAGVSLPIGIALRITVDALTGLHAAHELRDGAGELCHVVHRDVSPQNILVGCDGVTRLTDFGIAKADARLTFTADGQLKGKLAYMAPEQLRPSPEATRQTDVFAAGVVLWELLTGERLFAGKSDVEVFRQVLNDTIPPPSSRNPEVSPALDAAVLRAVAREPAERFASAEDFAVALEDCGPSAISCRGVSAFLRRVMPDVIAERTALLQRVAVLQVPGGAAAQRVLTGARMSTTTDRWHPALAAPDTLQPSTRPMRPRAAAPAARSGRRSVLAALGIGLVALASVAFGPDAPHSAPVARAASAAPSAAPITRARRPEPPSAAPAAEPRVQAAPVPAPAPSSAFEPERAASATAMSAPPAALQSVTPLASVTRAAAVELVRALETDAPARDSAAPREPVPARTAAERPRGERGWQRARATDATPAAPRTFRPSAI